MSRKKNSIRWCDLMCIFSTRMQHIEYFLHLSSVKIINYNADASIICWTNRCVLWTLFCYCMYRKRSTIPLSRGYFCFIFSIFRKMRCDWLSHVQIGVSGLACECLGDYKTNCPLELEIMINIKIILKNALEVEKCEWFTLWSQITTTHKQTFTNNHKNTHSHFVATFNAFVHLN